MQNSETSKKLEPVPSMLSFSMEDYLVIGFINQRAVKNCLITEK